MSGRLREKSRKEKPADNWIRGLFGIVSHRAIARLVLRLVLEADRGGGRVFSEQVNDEVSLVLARLLDRQRQVPLGRIARFAKLGFNQRLLLRAVNVKLPVIPLDVLRAQQQAGGFALIAFAVGELAHAQL